MYAVVNKLVFSFQIQTSQHNFSAQKSNYSALVCVISVVLLVCIKAYSVLQQTMCMKILPMVNSAFYASRVGKSCPTLTPAKQDDTWPAGWGYGGARSPVSSER